MIPAVVLAAGLSTRMGGRPKALLTLKDGRTFLRAISESLLSAGVDDLVVVVGHESDAVLDSIARDSLPVRAVLNPDYGAGQFSSLLKGLDAIDRPGVSAMLMTLVDVPQVSAATVRAVIDRFRQVAAPIVRPVRGPEHGHPVLIARSLFHEVRRADPGHGAKPIVRAHVSLAGDVVVDDAAAFLDVDTPDAHARLLAREHDA